MHLASTDKLTRKPRDRTYATQTNTKSGANKQQKHTQKTYAK